MHFVSCPLSAYVTCSKTFRKIALYINDAQYFAFIADAQLLNKSDTIKAVHALRQLSFLCVNIFAIHIQYIWA